MPDSPLRDAAFADLDLELATTRRVLDRVPYDGHADWTPHAKSMSLGALARHVAGLPRMAVMTLSTDEFDLAGARPPSDPVESSADLLAMWDRNVEALRGALSGADDDALSATWALRHGEHTVSADPRHLVIRRWALSHIAHHRGQLTVYLRLLDVPVPPVYGPTADER
jgi:uncharacterized damage-inducible protein DinB